MLGRPSTSKTRQLTTTASEAPWINDSPPTYTNPNDATPNNPNDISGDVINTTTIPLPSPERTLLLHQSPELDSRPVSTLFELPGSSPPLPSHAQDSSTPRTSTSKSRLFPPPRSPAAAVTSRGGRGGGVDGTVEDDATPRPRSGSRGGEGGGGGYSSDDQAVSANSPPLSMGSVPPIVLFAPDDPPPLPLSPMVSNE